VRWARGPQLPLVAPDVLQHHLITGLPGVPRQTVRVSEGFGRDCTGSRMAEAWLPSQSSRRKVPDGPPTLSPRVHIALPNLP
jgi:hypothetical protein